MTPKKNGFQKSAVWLLNVSALRPAFVDASVTVEALIGWAGSPPTSGPDWLVLPGFSGSTRHWPIDGPAGSLVAPHGTSLRGAVRTTMIRLAWAISN